jgi:hypothetical protein
MKTGTYTETTNKVAISNKYHVQTLKTNFLKVANKLNK